MINERILISDIAMFILIKELSNNVAENTNVLPRKNRWKRISISYLNKYLEFEIKFKQLLLDDKGKVRNDYNLFNSEIVYKLLRKIDEIHDLIDSETETNLLNDGVISKSLIYKIHSEVIYSPEMKYLCRIHSPHIIIEGPDRSGKSTLISQLSKFFKSSRRLMYNIITEVKHVTLKDKAINNLFLDLSTQEDRLLFQNILFNRVNKNIYNRNRYPIYYEQALLMDRSLLSNLIYSYVMLDEEHFRKYLFSNYRCSDPSLSEDSPEPQKSKPSFVFVEPINIEFSKRNPNLISSNYTITEFKTNNPFYKENDIIDLNSIFNDGLASSYCTTNSSKSSTVVKTLYKLMREYTLNVLYIKNTVYSFNKLDEIEKNVKQEKIIKLFSLFKDSKDLEELYKNKIHKDNLSNYKTFDEKDYEYSYNLFDLIVKNIRASFDLNSYKDIKISIIYDDNKERSAIETFDKCIEKLIDINEKLYISELNNYSTPFDGVDCCEGEGLPPI